MQLLGLSSCGYIWKFEIVDNDWLAYNQLRGHQYNRIGLSLNSLADAERLRESVNDVYV